MEDWQEWQIRADQIAADLNVETDSLDADLAGGAEAFNYRTFWPRFRDLKERVRTAPAIRLEAKLDLERRLRTIGSRAYKIQEAVQGKSGERRGEILEKIAALRSTAERETNPRSLRGLRREFDRLREEFDAGTALVPPDRQAVWDAWRDANQFAWQRLVDIWDANEAELREILTSARQQLERGNAGATRQMLGRFFDALRTREAKQAAVVAMKAEVDEIRREAEHIEERSVCQRPAQVHVLAAPVADGWRAELARNRELVARLAEDIAGLERQMKASGSILEQAMVRGTLVEKKRKLAELERSSRNLEQRIEQTEDTPLMPSA